MTVLELGSAIGSVRPVVRPAELQVRKQVGRIFQRHLPLQSKIDRRQDRREPFPYPVYVTPLDSDGLPQINQTFVVLGKHLSERGLDFYYQAPVPYRRVIASWECLDGQWLGLLLDLHWCRSNIHGWYENGGRFRQVVPSPLKDANLSMLSGANQTDPNTAHE